MEPEPSWLVVEGGIRRDPVLHLPVHKSSLRETSELIGVLSLSIPLARGQSNRIALEYYSPKIRK